MVGTFGLMLVVVFGWVGQFRVNQNVGEIRGAFECDSWSIVGFMLCHQVLNQERPNKLWIASLESSWVVALFRDEVLYIHSYIQSYFDCMKGYSKRISEVKDCYNQAIQKAALRHRERRKFLRTTLKELGLILTDQPGLLGPKALLIFIGLCFARDEVYWLLRHNDNPPLQKSKGKTTEDLVDRQMPELLFHMEELRDSIIDIIT
ncbi:unnamed protein product, partial [Timema podura]|nr:unnamed protein product [Timema podura]